MAPKHKASPIQCMQPRCLAWPTWGVWWCNTKSLYMYTMTPLIHVHVIASLANWLVHWARKFLHSRVSLALYYYYMQSLFGASLSWERLCGTRVDETWKANEDHGHRSKQTMTVIVAVYLSDLSPLHVVSIPCHVAMPTVNIYCSLARQSHSYTTVSVSSKSIPITFLATPRAIEPTVIDDKLCLWFPGSMFMPW